MNKAKDKKQKIAMKILSLIGGTTCLIFIAVAVVMFIVVKAQVDSSNETQLTLESQSASNELNTFFQRYLEMTRNLTVSPELMDAVAESSASRRLEKTSSYASAFEYLGNLQRDDSENVQAVWFASIAANELVMSDGYISGDDFDITTREWYQAAVKKTAMLTKPYVDVSTGQIVLTAAAPVYHPETGEVIGLAGLDLSLAHVTSILSECKIGDTGYVIMTASDSTVIYHPDSNVIQTLLSEQNISSNVISLIENKEDGFVKYQFNKETKYGYVTAIDDTGYVVLSCLTASEYSSSLLKMSVAMIVIFLVGMIVIFVAIRRVSAGITKPLELLDVAAQELASGNLDVHLEVTSNDEIGELERSIQQIVKQLKLYIAYIDEVSAVLGQMADGKLAISLKQEYAGEFGKIKDALLNISSSMTEVITAITESSNQVAGGSNDLANASQALAEGATNQASSVQELVATADNIVMELQTSKQNALDCAQEAKKVVSLADDSKNQMGDMLNAMQMISETSQQVVGIIHTIEEIADQTNLLSLNASIEAARAGEAGAGFAVVASEIGALANQSAQAAANSKKLIGVSMSEIEKGVALTNQVTEVLNTVVSGIDQVSEMVAHTADLAVEQESNMEQMQTGIDHIAQAVQDTSATAEESSATSEELAAQASMLTDLVGRFDLS